MIWKPELVRNRFEEAFAIGQLNSDGTYIHPRRQARWEGFQEGFKAALPTPEQYAQAARQIASQPWWKYVKAYGFTEQQLEQILTSILGQPGGKR